MRVVGLLAENYPRDEITPGRLAIFCAFLADVDEQRAALAVAEWVATQRYFPAVCDFRELLGRLSGDLAPDVDLAWAEVAGAVKACGAYRDPPVWSHRAIGEAVRAIGWRALCLSEHGDTTRAHFQRFYDASSKRATRASQTAGVRVIAAATRRVLAGEVLGGVGRLLPEGKKP